MQQQNFILINYMSMAGDAVGTIPEGMKINVGQESAQYLHGHHNLYEYTNQQNIVLNEIAYRIAVGSSTCLL